MTDTFHVEPADAFRATAEGTSEPGTEERAFGSTRHDRKLRVPGVIELLSLAATPVFMIMALLAGFAGDFSDTHHFAGHGAWSPGGMALMYVLMGIFHSAPWLRLVSLYRARARR